MSESSTKVAIAPFELASYDAVYALWRRCPGVGLSSADSLANITRYLAHNPGLSFIAKAEDQIVGAILGGHDGRRGYIHHLAVDPAWRRQGIAGRLVNHCLAGLAGEGINKCHLFIFHENSSGRAFWEAQGWEWRTDIRVMSGYI
jgi:putative acetyltransferase